MTGPELLQVLLELLLIGQTMKSIEEFEECIFCGCTEINACEGGCFWVFPGVCSSCLSRALAYVHELRKSGVKIDLPEKYDFSLGNLNDEGHFWVADYPDQHQAKVEILEKLPHALVNKAMKLLSNLIGDTDRHYIHQWYTENPNAWHLQLSYIWGLNVRRALRENICIDELLPSGTWETYYIPLVELALGCWTVESEGAVV